MGKRGNGEGSIHKRKDDRWEGALTVSYTEKGNPKRVRVYGKTRAEVAEKLNKLLLEHQRGTLVLPKRLTVEAFVAEWLAFKADQVRETTLAGYKSALGRHVLPRIGSLPLQKVQPLHLQRDAQRGSFAPHVSSDPYDHPQRFQTGAPLGADRSQPR